MDFLAKTFHGLEPVLAKELQALGAEQVRPINRAVQFQGDLAMLYRANYQLRTALRILYPIAHFQCRSERDLYQGIYKIDWSEWMSVQDTLAVDAVVRSQTFRHSKFVALKAKDAVVDQFRAKMRRRPSVDVEAPNLRIHVHINEQDCTVSLDSSGRSLHLRGYRQESVKAPINEVLAAGILSLAGWPQERPFLDPMCGSGTFPIEAALMSTNTPGQYLNPHFGFQKWPNFNRPLWKTVMVEGMKAKKNFLDVPFFGFDKNPGAIAAAQKNAHTAGVGRFLQIEQHNFTEISEVPKNGLLVMNPPYDERLPIEDIEGFYSEIGDQLKKTFPGYEAWIISSNHRATKSIGLRPAKRIVLFNGPLECRLLKFELYEGSRNDQTTSA